MNKRMLEKFIPFAFLHIEELKSADGSIKSTYFSHLESFGPSVTTSGMLTVLEFYKKAGEQGGLPERSEIYGILNKVLLEAKVLTKDKADIEKVLRDCGNDTGKKLILKRRILEAITACKHAIRTYPKKKEDKNDKR